jgi:hypothetical protein
MQIRVLRELLELDGVLLTVLIGSLGLNVFFGIAREQQSSAAAQSPPSLIAEGTPAPKFEGTSLSGARVTLDYAKQQRTTLLYVFSPTCQWCEKNLPNIRAIAKARPDLHVIGVNLGPPVDEKLARDQPFAEILKPTSSTARAYRFSGTPSTILISSAGKVMKAWSGAYTGRTAQDVSETLAVVLPGLLRDAAVRKGN